MIVIQNQDAHTSSQLCANPWILYMRPQGFPFISEGNERSQSRESIKDCLGIADIFLGLQLFSFLSIKLFSSLNAHHNFPDPKRTSLSCFFCPSNSPKPKNSNHRLINGKEMKRILIFRKISNVCLKND